MSDITVYLDNLGQAACFAGGEGATIVDGDSGKELSGQFTLVIGSIRSSPRSFGRGADRAWVEQRNGQWFLKRMRRLTFEFTPPLQLDAHGGSVIGSGPVLFCSIVDVEASEATSMLAIVSLESATISLLPGSGYNPLSNDFVFPKLAGESRIPLMRTSLDGVAWPGFFLQNNDGQVLMVSGGFPGGTSAVLNHHEAVSLNFPPLTQLKFPILSGTRVQIGRAHV